MLSGIRSEWKGKTIEIYEVVPEEPTVKIDSLGEVAKVSRVSFLVEKMIEEHGEQFGEVTVPLIGNLRNYSRFMDDQEVDSPFGNVDPSEVRERSGNTFSRATQGKVRETSYYPDDVPRDALEAVLRIYDGLRAIRKSKF